MKNDKINEMEFNESTKQQYISAFQAGVSVEERDGRTFVMPYNFTLFGSGKTFELITCEDKIYLTDQGVTLDALSERIALNKKGVAEAISKIIERYVVLRVDEELRIEMPTPKSAIACLIDLNAAMERVRCIDSVGLNLRNECDEADEKFWEIMEELVNADNEIDRNQAMTRLKAKSSRAQRVGDYEAAYAYVRTLRALADGDDAWFNYLRKEAMGIHGYKNPIPARVTETHFATWKSFPRESSKANAEVRRNSEIIIKALKDLGVKTQITRVAFGHTFSRYDLKIPSNIPVAKILTCEQEIATRLQEPNTNMYLNEELEAISIELPNSSRLSETVRLSEVLKSEEYLNAKSSSLMFAIGQDVEGEKICGDLSRMRHMLIGGCTNSGKTQFLRAMICSMIQKYSPEELRFILIEPKRTELSDFKELPHLLNGEIITEAEQTINALNWANKEMERRYFLFEQKTRSGTAVRNLEEYNGFCGEGEEKLAKIVIVVDEIADLMAVAKRDFEERVQRLAQKSRAAGIHLVLATQRPSVNVISGVIKTCMPTRIAFRTPLAVDSIVILDQEGAEKLIGKGDGLLKPDGTDECIRFQGTYVSPEELKEMVDAAKTKYSTDFD